MAVNPGLVQFSRIAGHGEIDIDNAQEQLPSVAGKAVYFATLPGNTGNIFIGGSTVTASDGATDTTTGLVLGPDRLLGPFPLVNGNRSGYYAFASAANQVLTYLVLA